MAEDIKDPKIDPNWTPPAAKTDDAPAEKPDTDAAIAELKRSLETERAARMEAERRAATAAQDAHKAKGEAADSQLQMVIGAISDVKRQNDYLESAMEQALAAGDARNAAKIQHELAANEAKLLQLENGKAAMESQPKPQAPAPQPQQRIADPVEAFVAQLGSSRSAAWIRAHPEYVTDQRLHQKMIAAHNLAVADGIQPDSDDYFAAVESTLRIRQPTENREDAMSAAAQPANRRDTAPPAAPVSRGGTNGRTARLSAEEMEIAELSGMTPEQYAANREALKKEGRYH